MGYPKKTAVDINPEAIRDAVSKSGYTATQISQIIGGADNYVSGLMNYGRGDSKKIKAIASLCKVDYESLLKPETPAEQPKAEQAGNVTAETLASILEAVNTLVRAVEKLDRRLDALTGEEVKQGEKLEAIRIKAISIHAENARMRAIWEGAKKG